MKHFAVRMKAMGYAKLKTKISVDDYLTGEEVSPVRYEYLHGDVYAMAGASQNHGRITMNFANLLLNKLRNSSCEVFAEGMKVKASEEVFYYPDVLVTCEGNFENRYYAESPVLIVEVISPSTERIDRREKLLTYRTLQSIREIVLISQQEVSVELHRRQSDGRWVTYYFDRTDTEFTLESVDLTLALDEVYRRVSFEAEANRVD